MATATAGRPMDESIAQITRVTKEGRTLLYRLNVIQQPERARACGSGAKSSADRRPVDPPPVVELRIFDGEGPDREDVTFSYNANFFLFATLEVARPIAHGRVQPPTPQVPVLTGMPVSGMAYLDRPTEAGYFIFPDLSVRHEGRYRLSFNLYEETKEAKDADSSPGKEQKPKVSGAPGATDSSFDWRLEVKSAMFTVFSAKKFPGLAESTALSRTVAEQGCRVRIRRDVRMRRRGEGKGQDYDDVPEDAYARSRAEEQEAFHRERSRSSSAGSDAARAPYPDGQHQSQHFNQFNPSQAAPRPSGPPGHLNFGTPTAQHQPPQPQFAQPQFPAPPSSYQPAPQQYHPPGSSQFRPAPLPAQQPQNNYGYERHPQSAYPSNPPREQREAYESEYRRASVGYAPPQHNAYPSAESMYRPPYAHPPRPRSPAMASPVNLAPLKMLPLEPKYETTSPPGPLSASNRIAPPLPSPAYERPHDRSAPYSQYPLASAPPAEPVRNGKRPFDSVFNSSVNTQPLFNGMRPSSSHNNSSAFDDDDNFDALQMSYKRADGTSYSRELPVLE